MHTTATFQVDVVPPQRCPHSAHSTDEHEAPGGLNPSSNDHNRSRSHNSAEDRHPSRSVFVATTSTGNSPTAERRFVQELMQLPCGFIQSLSVVGIDNKHDP
eukprot:TRINITY_DN6863_c0_g1_i4.p1 TRINITY_DN6863_c0_g1~~TRINITY_DN6863_c0_g1_i4.p1  ORF type:complete len:102 (-),score=3.99 TRINITY_DN6863_c0_g1_i4:617-922(-)